MDGGKGGAGAAGGMAAGISDGLAGGGAGKGKGFGTTSGIAEFAKSLQASLIKDSGAETADYTKKTAGILETIARDGIKVKNPITAMTT